MSVLNTSGVAKADPFKSESKTSMTGIEGDLFKKWAANFRDDDILTVEFEDKNGIRSFKVSSSTYFMEFAH